MRVQTDGEPASGRRSLGLAGNPAGIDHVSLTVDDIDETIREMSGRGVDFEGEPQTDEQWGLRMAGFRDPEGNSYFLVQAMEPAASHTASSP